MTENNEREPADGDGQFHDQQMPTTDGEPAEPDPRPSGTDEKGSEETTEPDGLGADNTIPREPDGVAAGHTGTPSTFEPEEDEQAQ